MTPLHRNEGGRTAAVLLVTSCLALIATGVVVTRTRPPAPVATLALGHVKDAQTVEIRSAKGDTVLSGEFRSRVDALGDTEKDAALYDRRGRTVIGEVEIEIPAASRPHRRPELEVDVMGLAPRESFTIAIDDRIVASFRTDDRGSVDLELVEGEEPALDLRGGGFMSPR
jgi:hypothetical protein